MKLHIGNIFDHQFDLILATTNSELNNKNHLVMGAGSAKDVKLRYPGIESIFGKLIDKQRDKHYWYGLVVVEYDDQLVGAFQTKTNYKWKADTSLISYSVEKLCEWCNANPDKTVALPYPGVGKGGLSIEEVEPLIAPLPNNVTVFLSEVREGVSFNDDKGYRWVTYDKHCGEWNCLLIGMSNGTLLTSGYNDSWFTEDEIINYINNQQQVQQLEVA